jgi:hypothetical protein
MLVLQVDVRSVREIWRDRDYELLCALDMKRMVKVSWTCLHEAEHLSQASS